MAGFALLDSIKVLTQTGECEIQLCLGDITKLELEDKVDVIMVSAFSGEEKHSLCSLLTLLDLKKICQTTNVFQAFKLLQQYCYKRNQGTYKVRKLENTVHIL